MKLSNAKTGPMPAPNWRHVVARLNVSDFAGVILLIALVMIALYSFRYGTVSDDGIPHHYNGQLFQIRYGAGALKH